MIATALCAAFLDLSASASSDTPVAPASAVIREIATRASDEGLEVSFRLEGAFGDDVVDRIHSGLEVTFIHRVELLARRAIPVIPARVLARTTAVAGVRYDSLTHQYHLSRRTTKEASNREAEPASQVSESVTSSLAEAEDWMASVQTVLIQGPPPDSSRKVWVQVRSVVGRRYRLLIFPADDAVEAEQVLSR